MEKITLRTRFIRAGMVGATGAVVAVAITLFERHFSGDWSFVRCAAGGAFLAGLVFARCFGGTGAWGMFRAGMGFGAATALGAICAVLLLPFDQALMNGLGLPGGYSLFDGVLSGSMIGPLFVLGEMIENFWVAMAWLAMLAGLHASAKWVGADA